MRLKTIETDSFKVIGSRKVSYILYLTDPTVDWQESWGGNLRLFATDWSKADTPKSDPQASLRIGWNRLAFFAVQPGQSFHDVEEVYRAEPDASDVARVRTAISGWYHVPQEGESGYRAGELEEHERSSGRASLKSIDKFDQPQPMPTRYPEYGPPPRKELGMGQPAYKSPLHENGVMVLKPVFGRDPDPTALTQGDIDFLLQYISPRWLVPDTVAELKDTFADESCLRIDDFLQPHFADLLKRGIEAGAEVEHQGLRKSSDVAKREDWKVAGPSHKQKYLYKFPNMANPNEPSTLSAKSRVIGPLKDIMCKLLPSQQFRKWLSFVTGVVLESYDIRTRRFRRGIDYQLAMPYKEEEPRLDFTLGLTPGGKWEDSDDEEEDQENEGAKPKDKKGKQPPASLEDGLFSDLVKQDQQETNNGGYECWMADDDDDPDSDSDHDSEMDVDADGSSPSKPKEKGKRPASDPAVYKASQDPSGDDGIAFSMPAGWNRLSLVMRDKGLLRFVKYVSKSAGCDRWDVVAEFGIDWDRTNEDAEYQDNDFFDGDEDDGEDDTDNDDNDDGNGRGKYGFNEESVSDDESGDGKGEAQRKRRLKDSGLPSSKQQKRH